MQPGGPRMGRQMGGEKSGIEEGGGAFGSSGEQRDLRGQSEG